MWRRRCFGVLAIVSLFGAAPLARAETPSGCGPNGRIAMWTSDGAVDVIEADGTARWTLASSTSGLVESSTVTEPSWSPDGRWLAYGFSELTATMAAATGIRLISVDGDVRRQPLSLVPVGRVTEVAWSPDGRRIAFVLWISNTPVQVATWTPVGDHAALYVVQRDGTGLRAVLTANPNTITELDWAPDGRHLAFTNGFGVAGVDIVDVDAAVPVARRVSAPTLSASRPKWSPDGAHLAFFAAPVTNPLSPTRVFVAEPTGANARALPIMSWDWDVPTWSPDGRWVAAATWLSGITAVRIDTGELRKLTDGPYDWMATWSPDGRRIAFVREDPSDYSDSVWTADLSDGRMRQVSSPGGYARLSWCPRS